MRASGDRNEAIGRPADDFRPEPGRGAPLLDRMALEELDDQLGGSVVLELLAAFAVELDCGAEELLAATDPESAAHRMAGAAGAVGATRLAAVLREMGLSGWSRVASAELVGLIEATRHAVHEWSEARAPSR